MGPQGEGVGPGPGALARVSGQPAAMAAQPVLGRARDLPLKTASLREHSQTTLPTHLKCTTLRFSVDSQTKREAGEKERVRNTNQLLLTRPPLGTRPTTQARAFTGAFRSRAGAPPTEPHQPGQDF